MTIIGIDPGKNGAIAELDGDELIGFTLMPLTNGTYDFLKLVDTIENATPHGIVVEKLRPRPPIGRPAAFGLGQAYQVCLDAAAVQECGFEVVDPQQWKKTVLVGLDWAKNKACSEIWVRRRFPKIDLPKDKESRSGVCDAICIAMYGFIRMK